MRQITGEEFGKMVKEAKLHVKQCCALAGVTQSTASNWINGKRATRLSVIAKLLNAYEELRGKK